MPSPCARTFLALAALAACAPPVIEGTSLPASTSGDSSSSEPDPSTAGESTSPQNSTGETTDEPTTAGPSPPETTDPTTSSPDVCGNHVIDPGELCDDGNLDETDDCTTLCKPPSCTDGLVSGDEAALDCGGSCPGCGAGQPCTVKEDCASLACDGGSCTDLFESCRLLLEAHPGLPDEAYDIDPGLDGSTLHVYCDMMNGGWTEVVKDPVDDPNGWSLGNMGACGNLAAPMLGPFGMGQTVGKLYNLPGVPHVQARGHATFIIIDSWDGERARLVLDGDEVDARDCHFINNPMVCAMKDNQCGAGAFPDGRVDVVGQTAHTADAILVELSTTLDEAIDNEAFGVDQVSVFVY